MLKFHPGIQKDFITRWVQFTHKSFRYYENQYRSLGSAKNLVGPLLSVPINKLSKCILVDPEEFQIQKNRNYEN